MGLISADMKRVVETTRLGFIATVCPDGTPNLSPKGTTAVWDADHLVFANIRSPGTLANLRQNPNVEVNVSPRAPSTTRSSPSTQSAAGRASSARSSWCGCTGRNQLILPPTTWVSPKPKCARDGHGTGKRCTVRRRLRPLASNSRGGAASARKLPVVSASALSTPLTKWTPISCAQH
jgi:hypothetical protein